MGKRRRKSQPIVEEPNEDRYFLNPESVSRHLYCSICQEVFTEPHRAPCGHSYCKACIMQWLKTSKTCPEDRMPVKPTDLHHDFILENIIGDQMVACPYRENGCSFIDQLQLLATHRKSCSFNPHNLPDFIKQELRDDKLRKNSATAQSPLNVDTEPDAEESALPECLTPPLKLRLFQAGGDRRNMLCSMFDSQPTTSGSAISGSAKSGSAKSRSRKSGSKKS